MKEIFAGWPIRTVSVRACKARFKIQTKPVDVFVAISSDAGSIPAASTI
jgi:hypothetical protein